MEGRAVGVGRGDSIPQGQAAGGQVGGAARSTWRGCSSGIRENKQKTKGPRPESQEEGGRGRPPGRQSAEGLRGSGETLRKGLQDAPPDGDMKVRRAEGGGGRGPEPAVMGQVQGRALSTLLRESRWNRQDRAGEGPAGARVERKAEVCGQRCGMGDGWVEGGKPGAWGACLGLSTERWRHLPSRGRFAKGTENKETR